MFQDDNHHCGTENTKVAERASTEEQLKSADVDELVKQLAATPNRIRQLIGDPANDFRYRPSDGRFSVLENICHLRDIEVEGYALRIKRILEEDLPELPDIDGGRLALERDYNSQDLMTALNTFAEARKANVSRLRDIDPSELEKAGKLEGVGEVTLERLLEMMIEHDEGHLAELQILQRRLT